MYSMCIELLHYYINLITLYRKHTCMYLYKITLSHWGYRKILETTIPNYNFSNEIENFSLKIRISTYLMHDHVSVIDNKGREQ